MTAILLAVALTCIFLLIYPYVIYPIILKLIPEKPIIKKPGNQLPATLVFCAYNEGAVIAEKITNIEALKTRHPNLEILAFDDGSTDDTYTQLSARPDLLTVLQGGGRNGKANGMKRLASLAKGEIIIFTDANVLLKADAIDNLFAWYADPSVGGVCGALKYLGENESATASVGGLYWRQEERLKSEESRTGNVMGADGSIFSIRRDLYPEFPDTVLDDLTVSMAVVFAGKRLIKVDDVIAFERLVAARKEEFSRKVRISARAYHTHLYLHSNIAKMAKIDQFKYYSRKFIRWFGGIFLITAFIATIALVLMYSPPIAGSLAAAAGIFAFFGARAKKGPAGAVADIVLALFATMIGVFRAMRGKTVVVWSPAKSR